MKYKYITFTFLLIIFCSCKLLNKHNGFTYVKGNLHEVYPSVKDSVNVSGDFIIYKVTLNDFVSFLESLPNLNNVDLLRLLSKTEQISLVDGKPEISLNHKSKDVIIGVTAMGKQEFLEWMVEKNGRIPNYSALREASSFEIRQARFVTKTKDQAFIIAASFLGKTSNVSF